MEKDEKPGIFQQFRDLTSLAIEAKIHKAEAELKEKVKKQEDEDEIFYAKSLLEDPSYSVHSSGWREKPHRLQNGHLKMMSLKSSLVSAIILTRQNQVSTFSRLMPSGRKKGWRIVIKNEKLLVSKATDTLKKAENGENTADLTDWELRRKALHKIRDEHAEARQQVEEYVSNCGLEEDRPFQSHKWGFDAILRAWVQRKSS